MTTAIATTFSSVPPTTSSSPSPTLKTLGFTTTFLSSKTSFKSLHACVFPSNMTSVSVMGARMVASPTITKSPVSLDFETSVFKKEKVNLAGHEEEPRRINKIACIRKTYIAGASGDFWFEILNRSVVF
ncbi:putative ketol-acid reductoisomerase (NADP(+)) [Helianthus annuus]|nr:putative ketol-acid reductoisomerase (NADP(+)) [Helianthus annuus]